MSARIFSVPPYFGSPNISHQFSSEIAVEDVVEALEETVLVAGEVVLAAVVVVDATVVSDVLEQEVNNILITMTATNNTSRKFPFIYFSPSS